MNEIITIQGIPCYEKDGTAYLSLEAVARGLGFTQEKNGVQYVKWERVQSYLSDLGFSPQVGKDAFIPENVFYRLAMKAKNEVAERFQAKIADDVIPTIRKTGSYQANKPACLEDVLIQQLQEMKNIRLRLDTTEHRIDGIREIVAVNPNAWREECRTLISRIAQARGGGGAYQEVNNEVYAAVDARAGASLSSRLTNLRRRMADEGECRSKRDRLTKVDVIAQDKRLTEVYIAVVKDMALANGVWEEEQKNG